MNVKSPCKKDCPKRHSGCAIKCPEWREYLEKRNKEYEKRIAQNAKRFKYRDSI